MEVTLSFLASAQIIHSQVFHFIAIILSFDSVFRAANFQSGDGNAWASTRDARIAQLQFRAPPPLCIQALEAFSFSIRAIAERYLGSLVFCVSLLISCHSSTTTRCTRPFKRDHDHTRNSRRPESPRLILAEQAARDPTTCEETEDRVR